MAFHPFEVNVPHLAYAFLGGFVVIVSLFSSFFFLVLSVVRGFGSGFYPLSSFLPSIYHPPDLSVFIAPSLFFGTPLVLRHDDLSVCRFVGLWRNSGIPTCMVGMSGRVILHSRSPMAVAIAIASTIRRSFFASEQASRSKQTEANRSKQTYKQACRSNQASKQQVENAQLCRARGASTPNRVVMVVFGGNHNDDEDHGS
jgi:hypothetical protein